MFARPFTSPDGTPNAKLSLSHFNIANHVPEKTKTKNKNKNPLVIYLHKNILVYSTIPLPHFHHFPTKSSLTRNPKLKIQTTACLFKQHQPKTNEQKTLSISLRKFNAAQMLQHDRQDKKASVIVSMETMQQGVRQLLSWKTELCVSFPNFPPQKTKQNKVSPFFHFR